jgi:hypothetical protein
LPITELRGKNHVAPWGICKGNNRDLVSALTRPRLPRRKREHTPGMREREDATGRPALDQKEGPPAKAARYACLNQMAWDWKPNSRPRHSRPARPHRESHRGLFQQRPEGCCRGHVRSSRARLPSVEPRTPSSPSSRNRILAPHHRTSELLSSSAPFRAGTGM